ncbi:MAG: amidohydrolase family protein, partial [Acinetobacter junii]
MTFKYLNKLTTATIIAFTLSGCASTPLDQDRSEQLFFGGSILTMEGMTPTYAEALLVKDGKIIFVGSKKQAEHLANSNVQSIDLKNKTLLPSFIDAHSHVNMVGFHQMVANLYPAP